MSENLSLILVYVRNYGFRNSEDALGQDRTDRVSRGQHKQWSLDIPYPAHSYSRMDLGLVLMVLIAFIIAIVTFFDYNIVINLR